MKKTLLIFCSLIIAELTIQAQTTYYWKGAVGTALAPTDWAVASNWNTATDGTGSARTSPATDDILVFDGLVAPGTLYIGNIGRETIDKLWLKNNAVVTITSVAAQSIIADAVTNTATYGGCTYTITGSNFTSNLKKGDFIYSGTDLSKPAQVLAIKDANTITTSSENAFATSASGYTRYATLYTTSLLIEAGSTFNFATNTSNSPFIPFALITKGGIIAGAVNFVGRGSISKLYCTTPNLGNASDGLHFVSGSSCTYNTNIFYQKQYPLGNTLGAYDGSGNFVLDGGNGANNLTPGYSGNAGIVFDSGSTFTNTGGNQLSVFGGSNTAISPLVFTPAVYFVSGSNYISNTGSNNSVYFPVIAGIQYANLELKAGFPSNLSLTSVDNLIISGTTAAVTSNTGTIVVKGSITNSTANSINLGTVFLAGTSNQSITPGSGALVFNTLTVADKAIATLGGNITTTNLNIVGKLNFGSFTSTGTGTLSTYAGPYTKTTGKTAFTKGSTVVGGLNNTGVGTLTYQYPIGASLTNASYIPANTIYKSYTGSAIGGMSNFATATIDTVSASEKITLSIAGSSYTSSSDLATSTPGFATRLLDINSTTLPLDLLSFDGSARANGITLRWNTAKEINVKGFIIQKRVANGSFVDLAQVSASNSVVLNNYLYTDLTADAGVTNYYRLKVIDNDGAFKLSNVIGILMSGFDTGSHGLSIYPNPATSVLNVVCNEPGKGAEYKVLTVEGRIVLKGVVDAKSTTATIDISALPAGTYVIDYSLQNSRQKGKFIKK